MPLSTIDAAREMGVTILTEATQIAGTFAAVYGCFVAPIGWGHRAEIPYGIGKGLKFL